MSPPTTAAQKTNGGQKMIQARIRHRDELQIPGAIPGCLAHLAGAGLLAIAVVCGCIRGFLLVFAAARMMRFFRSGGHGTPPAGRSPDDDRYQNGCKAHPHGPYDADGGASIQSLFSRMPSIFLKDSALIHRRTTPSGKTAALPGGGSRSPNGHSGPHADPA